LLDVLRGVERVVRPLARDEAEVGLFGVGEIVVHIDWYCALASLEISHVHGLVRHADVPVVREYPLKVDLQIWSRQ
jgi:hypothetical protein